MRTKHTPVLALVLPALAFLAACEKKAVPPKPPPVVPVRTAAVATRDIPVEYAFPASIASPQSVDVNARVPGWLLRQATADGARVAKGTLLYEIDPSQYQVDLDAANARVAQAEAQAALGRAQLDAATAQAALAQETFDRNKGLVASGAVSRERFDQITASLAEAKASVEQAKAAIAVAEANRLEATADVESAKLHLSYCSVASPIDGLLGASRYYAGTLVGDAGKQLLNVVVQTDPIWAEFRPSANVLPEFRANLAAGTLTARVELKGANLRPAASAPIEPAAASPTAEARLVFIDNVVSETSDTILMRIELANPDSVFLPGAYAEVTVGLGVQKGATVVPSAAVFARQTELFVWRVKADETVESVRIEALTSAGNDVVVGAGVAPGDRIVTDGIAKLRAGMRIKDLGTSPASESPAEAVAPAGPARGK